MSIIDIIRTKSIIGKSYIVKTTCKRLGLPYTNNRAIIQANDSSRGMLAHLGEVAIWTERETEPVNKNLRLHPPTKGYPRDVSRTGGLTTEQYDRVLSRMTRL